MKSKKFSIVISLESFRNLNEEEVKLEIENAIEELDGIGIKKIQVKEMNK